MQNVGCIAVTHDTGDSTGIWIMVRPEL